MREIVADLNETVCASPKWEGISEAILHDGSLPSVCSQICHQSHLWIESHFWNDKFLKK